MARAGSFGGSLNPFGSGSARGFAGYDIGGWMADFALYQVEVRWRNGEATDDEYLAALLAARDARTPGTRDYIAADDRYQDAKYRIERSRLEGDLDALIAFDQAWLGRLNPDSLRYRDLAQSLAAELAQRRSRDYGRLVARYNAGELSTQQLLDWVNETLANLPADAPDAEDWQNRARDLAERIKRERDAEVYQDYQMRRLPAADFLAYIRSRRDEYDPASPDWADWNRRLEDAERSVRETEQARADQEFFNRYQEGKVSDADYLAYLRRRIQGMAPDDPDLPVWQHRLNQAAFSIAEDQLRFEVEMGRRPVADLIRFYENYRRTLNPGSAEYRQITRQIVSLRRRGGGGGGGSSKGGKAGAGAGEAIGKAISPTYSLDTIWPLLTINPAAPKAERKAAESMFNLNYASLENARQRGDDVWLFYDPRHPEATVQAQDPSGRPVVGPDGKPVMVRGSAYLPVSDEAFAQLNRLRADYFAGLAEIALADHNIKDYGSFMRRAIEAEDKARRVSAEGVSRQNVRLAELTVAGIEEAIASQDYATALNLWREAEMRLASDLANPMLDDARRERLTKLAERLGDNPLFPKVDPVTGVQVGGAADLEASAVDEDGNFVFVAIRPGWHFVLDRTDEYGRPRWGLVYDDLQDGSFEADHVTVQTKRGDRVITGEVRRRTSDAPLTVYVRLEDGRLMALRTPSVAEMIAFPDEYGRIVRAYSIDGVTWIRPLDGGLPALELSASGLRMSEDATGAMVLVDVTGAPVFRSEDGGASWRPDETWHAQNSGAVAWWGQRAYEATRAYYQAAATGEMAQLRRLGAELTAAQEQERLGRLQMRRAMDLASIEIGGPGQAMQLATAGVNGLNLLPPAMPVLRTAADRRGEQDALRVFALGPQAEARERARQEHLALIAARTGGGDDEPWSERVLSTLGDAVGVGRLFAPLAPLVRPAVARLMEEVARRSLSPDEPARFEGVPLRQRTLTPPPIPPAPPPVQIGKETGDIAYRPTARPGLPPPPISTLPPVPRSPAPPPVQIGKETGDIAYRPTARRRPTRPKAPSAPKPTTGMKAV